MPWLNGVRNGREGVEIPVTKRCGVAISVNPVKSGALESGGRFQHALTADSPGADVDGFSLLGHEFGPYHNSGRPTLPCQATQERGGDHEQ
jgi:hypothetical protein